MRASMASTSPIETLEGLAKHNGPLTGQGRHETVLRQEIEAAGLTDRLHLDAFAPAEAQAAAIADDIAYNSHDLDDGLRAGLIRLDDLVDVPLAGGFVADACRAPGSRRSAPSTRSTGA